ncbi:MAG: hypothetical protein Q9223_005801, partial [Gallowayella weberi]
IDFFFINGSFECPPAIGVAEQYDGPYYRFLTQDGPEVKDLVRLARSMSKSALSPEDFAREWLRRGMTNIPASQACDIVEHQIEQHPDGPFDGVLGFSEGCSVVASLMLRRAARGQTPLFRFATFFCAISAFRFDEHGAILADECPERINVPTLHIVGARDPALLSSMTVYNLCDRDSAVLYDHGKGHTIPWGSATKMIVDGFRQTLQRAHVDLDLSGQAENNDH